MSSFACPICPTSRHFVSFHKMFQHITLYHQNEANFQVTCDLNEKCGVLYRTYAAYKAHVYRTHPSQLQSMKQQHKYSNMNYIHNQQEEINGDNDVIDYDQIADDDDDDEVKSVSSENDDMNDYQASPFNSIRDDEQSSGLLSDIKKSYLSFLLQLREELLLPQNATNIISTYIISLLQNVQELLERKTVQYASDEYSQASSLQLQNKTVVQLNDLKLVFEDTCNTIDSITKNEYRFSKNCERYLNFISPEEIIVSSSGESLQRAYFIPIDRTLSLMFKSKSLVNQILENIQQQRQSTELDSDLMFSIRDGQFGSRIDHENILIQLYLDDIGLTNPLGSKRDQHKMSMVYFSVEDVPDKYRSKLDFIQLVAVCESHILKDNTKSERFFRPIIENLNCLQIHGLLVHNVHLRFSFSTVVADNLAAHLIGGFQSSFNNGYFCRRCYVTYAEKNLPISYTQMKPRTMLDHDHLIQQIVNNPNASSLMGVVGLSPLHGLAGFHPTTSLPGDAMHDFIEGVCPMILVCLLKQASSMRLITYEHDVDGEMLKLMSTIERISQLIPKFKYQLMFLEEREKLFGKVNNNPVGNDNQLSTPPAASQTLPIISTNSSSSFSSSLGTTSSANSPSPTTTTNDSTLKKSSDGGNTTISFPDVYQIPLLPSALVKDIEDGSLSKFAPHCSNRQILIDAISFDLLENYKLFYPSKKQFNDIAIAIVKYLKLSCTSENLGIWKDALQTKLKRKRSEYANNTEVQEFRRRYSQLGSGRPVKRKIDQIAERDRHKQILLMPVNDDLPGDIQSKAEQLRDFSQIDFNTRLALWKQTFHFRRQFVRDQSTNDAVEAFPGYGDSFLIFEEVKLLMQVDLSSEVQRKIPMLLDKVLDTQIFVTDSPPIRLIKTLCKQFDETVQHLFCEKEPPTPYPTLVCIDDAIHVYVNFCSVTSTSSPEDALALLIAMYTIFELAFDKKSRTVRLLYSVFYGDKQFLSNNLRLFINEKQIDIKCQRIKIQANSSSSSFDNSAAAIVQSSTQSKTITNSFDDAVVEHDSITISQTTPSATTDDNLHSASEDFIDTNECTENTGNTSPSALSSQSETKRTRKRKQISDLNERSDAFDGNAGQTNRESSAVNRPPLDDTTNSMLRPRRVKRTRNLN